MASTAPLKTLQPPAKAACAYSPVTSTQMTWWTFLGVAWLVLSVASLAPSIFDRRTRSVMRSLSGLALLALLVWLLYFAASVRCPLAGKSSSGGHNESA